MRGNKFSNKDIPENNSRRKSDKKYLKQGNNIIQGQQVCMHLRYFYQMQIKVDFWFHVFSLHQYAQKLCGNIYM